MTHGQTVLVLLFILALIELSPMGIPPIAQSVAANATLAANAPAGAPAARLRYVSNQQSSTKAQLYPITLRSGELVPLGAAVKDTQLTGLAGEPISLARYAIANVPKAQQSTVPRRCGHRGAHCAQRTRGRPDLPT